jgi:hypothetical protein
MGMLGRVWRPWVEDREAVRWYLEKLEKDESREVLEKL